MDSDFEYQLQCEAEAKRQEAAAAGSTASSLSAASGTYVDPQDGTVYEWDGIRRAWFPKVDDNFLAVYQASYGLNPLVPSADHPVAVSNEGISLAEKDETQRGKVREHFDDLDDDEYDQQPASSSRDKKKQKTSSSKDVKDLGAGPKGQEKKKVAEPPAWFDVDDEHNRNVYVSNLPVSTTEEEFVELMQKCGIVAPDPRRNNKPKIKMYKDKDGNFKGDALCTYMKIESIPLALQIIDGYEFNRNKIKVEIAKFNVKGQFDADKAKAGRLKKNEKKRLEKAETKMLDWRPDKLPGGRPKNEKTVVISNMFDPKEFESEPELILEFKQDLQPECEKFGEVKKITIYDRNPEGVATITFSEFDAADSCLRRMNGRFFAGKQLSATLWDGKTKYRVEETEEEKEQRLGQWDKFLKTDT